MAAQTLVSSQLNGPSCSSWSQAEERPRLGARDSSSVSRSVGMCCNGKVVKNRRLLAQRLNIFSLTQFTQTCTTSRLTCNAANTAQPVKFSRDVLTETQLKQWLQASLFLEGLGCNAEEADRVLGKAFGWVKSPYWSESTEQTLPELEEISSKVDFVRDMGFSDTELISVLKKFPELLGCRETLMKHNVGILDKQWGIAAKTLKGLVVRNPQVLGYSVDCRGDCMAQCTRCWVRF